MKALKHIREGSIVKILSEDSLYFIRGKAKNGRVHLKAFFRDDIEINHKGERYSHADVYLPKDEKVVV